MRFQLAHVRHCQLGCRRGRRSAQVGDKIADGKVCFMTDRRDDRRAARGDRACEGFVVERPQILHRAAASADDQHVALSLRVELPQGVDQLCRRSLALHQNRRQHHVDSRKTPVQNIADVLHRRAGRRGDDAHGFWEPRQPLFARRVKQPLRFELLFELFVGERQRAHAVGLHVLDIELILSRRLIYRHPAATQHLHAVLRTEPQTARVAGKHHGAQHAAAILQRQINMTAAVVVGQV